MEISGIPAASTLHGLSAVSPDHPLYVGMLGMLVTTHQIN